MLFINNNNIDDYDINYRGKERKEVSDIILDTNRSFLSVLTLLPNLRFLDISRTNVTSLFGIDCCKNLHTLYCNNNRIDSLADIVTISSLKVLDVSSNRLHDLKGICYLRNLQYLNASCNSIRSVRGIDRCLNLTYIDLHSNNINKIRYLAPLYFVETLIVSNNHLTNLWGIQCMYFLKYLDLSNNSVESLKPVRYCHWIKILKCSSNNLTSIKYLNNCPKIQALEINNNNIKDLQPLLYLRYLKQLTINKLKDNVSPEVKDIIEDLENKSVLSDFFPGVHINDRFYRHPYGLYHDDPTCQKSIEISLTNLDLEPRCKYTPALLERLGFDIDTINIIGRLTSDRTIDHFIVMNFEGFMERIMHLLTIHSEKSQVISELQKIIPLCKHLPMKERAIEILHAISPWFPDLEIHFSPIVKIDREISKILNSDLFPSYLQKSQEEMVQIIQEKLGTKDYSSVKYWVDSHIRYEKFDTPKTLGVVYTDK